jgi:pre-mRNA 3'-end-processing factor FIP1
MDEEDEDLYGPTETGAPVKKENDAQNGSDGEQDDQTMDEGLESGEDDDEDDSDSVCSPTSARATTR